MVGSCCVPRLALHTRSLVAGSLLNSHMGQVSALRVTLRIQPKFKFHIERLNDASDSGVVLCMRGVACCVNESPLLWCGSGSVIAVLAILAAHALLPFGVLHLSFSRADLPMRTRTHCVDGAVRTLWQLVYCMYVCDLQDSTGTLGTQL